jgi:hypothetical protein
MAILHCTVQTGLLHHLHYLLYSCWQSLAYGPCLMLLGCRPPPHQSEKVYAVPSPSLLLGRLDPPPSHTVCISSNIFIYISSGGRQFHYFPVHGYAGGVRGGRGGGEMGGGERGGWRVKRGGRGGGGTGGEDNGGEDRGGEGGDGGDGREERG